MNINNKRFMKKIYIYILYMVINTYYILSLSYLWTNNNRNFY